MIRALKAPASRPLRIMAALRSAEDEPAVFDALRRFGSFLGATLWLVRVIEEDAPDSAQRTISIDVLTEVEASLMHGAEDARIDDMDVRPLILSGRVESELPAAAALMEVDLLVLGSRPGHPPLDLLTRLSRRCPTCRILLVPRERRTDD